MADGYCGQCGNALSGAGHFCGRCGATTPAARGQSLSAVAAPAADANPYEGTQQFAPVAGPDAENATAYIPPVWAGANQYGPAGQYDQAGQYGLEGQYEPKGQFYPAGQFKPAADTGLAPPDNPRRTWLWWIVGGIAAAIIVAAVAVTIIVAARSGPKPAHTSAAAAAAPTSPAATTTVPATSVAPTVTVTAPAKPTLPVTRTSIDLNAVVRAPQLAAIASTLDTYFTGINAHDPQAAASAFVPGGSLNPNDPQAMLTFGDAISTTTDSQIAVHSYKRGSSGRLLMKVTFQSQQDPSKGVNGEGCTNWSLTYVMAPRAGGGYGLLKSQDAINAAC